MNQRPKSFLLLGFLLIAVVIFTYYFLDSFDKGVTKTLSKDAFQLTKADRIDLAFKQEFLKTFDPQTKDIPRERLRAAKELIRNRKNLRVETKAQNLTWTERGPYNVGGRTKAILWDPQTTGKVWAGAASGGLWYNTDITNSSSTWTAVDDLMENLSVTAIVYDPIDSDTMYIGTGEGHIIGSVRGAGMFKSTDAGATWTQMIPGDGFYDTESNFHYVNDILVVDEGGDEGVIYVATQASLNEYTYYGYGLSGVNGIWRSTDGGVTFTEVLGNIPGQSYAYPIADLEIDSNGRIYAGTAADIYGNATAFIFYSDNGTTWNQAYDFGGGDRVELAVAPTDASRIYAVAADGGVVLDLVKATNAVASPTTWTGTGVTVPSHYDPSTFGGSCGVICNASGDFTRDSQAFYDLILRVNPTDPDEVWVGGIDLHRSSDAGSSWDQMTTWYEDGANSCFCLPYVHADQHVLEFNPSNSSQLLSGNDGGVALTSDAAATTPSWVTMNNNYNVTQFYGGAINPTASSNQFLAGAQDNGSQYFNSAGMVTTIEASGGDGAFCNIDQDEPQYQWTQYVYNVYYRSNDSGVNFGNSITLGGSTGRFINPSAYDDTENIMYAAGNANQFLRWTNPQSGSTSSFETSNFGGHLVSALAVSPNVSNRVYFGTGNDGIAETGSGNLYYIDNAHNSTTAVEISGASFPANSYLSCISIEDGNENHIVVTFSNYGVASVWETTDGGTNWTNIEGNLPDMPVRWAVVHPSDPNRIFLATELGVWSTLETNRGSTDWTSHDDEYFPHVRTDMLKVRTSDLEMIALTHGRGLWSTNITIPLTTDPEISFVSTTNTQSESTTASDGCRNYTDYTVAMQIANPPTGDAIVTLAVDGASTATEGYDYDITTTDFITPSSDLTFANGATANQNFTLRVYNDEDVESTENFVINYSISGSTDAIAGSTKQTYDFNINDNDLAPIINDYTVLLSETFDSQTTFVGAGWTPISYTAGNNDWRLGTQIILTGTKSAYVSRGDGFADYTHNSTSDVGIATPIMDASSLGDLTLSFNYRCNGELSGGVYYDFGSIHYAIDSDDDGDITDEASVQIATNFQGVTATTAYFANLPVALEGEKFAIIFRWENDGSVRNNPAFVIDDVVITGGTSGTDIAAVAAQTYEGYLGPNETVHFYNGGEILMSIENLSSFDYGCTTITIESGGTSSISINGTTSPYFPASKTYSVTPTNNSATGEYTITLYYLDTEIDGWASATGLTNTDLEIIKVEGTLDGSVLDNELSWEATIPTISTFGSHYTLQASFSTGFSSFGVGNTTDWPIPLPVELIHFNAELKDSGVLLSWQTATEINSDFFEIHHSIDGENFNVIATVDAAGQSSSLIDYSYSHQSPAIGTNYYRLKIVDTDGSFKLSKIKSVSTQPDFAKTFRVHPNPVADQLTVELESIQSTSIKVLSVDGKEVYNSHVGPGYKVITIPFETFKSGLYFVQVSSGSKTLAQKVVRR